MIATVTYWALIFFAWWETRFRVFLGAEIFMELSARKGFSDIISNLEKLEGNAWTSLANSTPPHGIFLLVPIAMTVMMFAAPLLVRKDYRSAVKGVFVLPATVVLCYIFASLMNLVVAAGINLLICLYLQVKPGPDFFVHLVHPLYLFAPSIMANAPGLLSQCVYMLFIASVLTIPGKRRWMPYPDEPDERTTGGDENADPDEPEEKDENCNACVLEMDRLCRIIETKTEHPELAHLVKADISYYIDTDENVARAIEAGFTTYKIVLVEAAKALKAVIDEAPDTRGAKDAFLYVADEMRRMEYCNSEEHSALREWAEKAAR